MINIRPYRHSDYEMIASWWTQHGEAGPLPGMMVEDGTFVVEVDQAPVMSLTCFLTQSKQIAYFEGYVAKPGISKKLSNECGRELWNHCFDYARERGYSNVICYTYREKLAKRYEELGMQRSTSGLHSLVRSL